jgi:hypothetical protein
MRDHHAGGMPREPGEVLCGREIDSRFLVLLHNGITALHGAMLARNLGKGSIAKDFGAIFMMLSSIPHLRFHDLPRFTVDTLHVNFNARKAFVSNAMPLSRFKQTIFRNHVNTLKLEQISQIIQAVIQATTDIAFRFQHFIIHHSIHHASTDWHSITSITHEFALELFNLKSYSDSELAIIHTDFHSTPSKMTFFNSIDFKIVNVLKPYHASYDNTRYFPLTH